MFTYSIITNRTINDNKKFIPYRMICCMMKGFFWRHTWKSLSPIHKLFLERYSVGLLKLTSLRKRNEAKPTNQKCLYSTVLPYKVYCFQKTRNLKSSLKVKYSTHALRSLKKTLSTLTIDSKIIKLNIFKNINKSVQPKHKIRDGRTLYKHSNRS